MHDRKRESHTRKVCFNDRPANNLFIYKNVWRALANFDVSLYIHHKN